MLNILRTFQLGFHRFFSLYLCSAWNRRDRDASTAPTAQNAPNMRESCSRAATLPPAPREEGSSHGARQAAEPRWCSRRGPGADVTTKAQMTPHFSFVHRNESWNNSFILHYWQQTILTLTLVVCSNASISCHCLSSEMKTALYWSGYELKTKQLPWILYDFFFFKYRYSVFENRYSIAKQNIAILTCIDIFLHP